MLRINLSLKKRIQLVNLLRYSIGVFVTCAFYYFKTNLGWTQNQLRINWSLKKRIQLVNLLRYLISFWYFCALYSLKTSSRSRIHHTQFLIHHCESCCWCLTHSFNTSKKRTVCQEYQHNLAFLETQRISPCAISIQNLITFDLVEFVESVDTTRSGRVDISQSQICPTAPRPIYQFRLQHIRSRTSIETFSFCCETQMINWKGSLCCFGSNLCLYGTVSYFHTLFKIIQPVHFAHQ